jgi:uncharacterized damage-inducible protein DinB
MTALELLKYEIDEAGAQIERSMDGLEEKDADYRVADHAMSFRELVIHLCDVYKAIPTQLAGTEYDWGSFIPPSSEWPALLSTMRSMRVEAVNEVLADDEAKLKAGAGFLVGHDNYHVGQVVTTRLGLQPEWNSYSIYC